MKHGIAILTALILISTADAQPFAGGSLCSRPPPEALEIVCEHCADYVPWKGDDPVDRPFPKTL